MDTQLQFRPGYRAPEVYPRPLVEPPSDAFVRTVEGNTDSLVALRARRFSLVRAFVRDM